ncbi:MAG TPA: hypothetical protein VN637_06745, partial [Roseiarcus sp.]|nr:hypothetical protein [Roseiarcus sp.]
MLDKEKSTICDKPDGIPILLFFRNMRKRFAASLVGLASFARGAASWPGLSELVRACPGQPR